MGARAVEGAASVPSPLAPGGIFNGVVFVNFEGFEVKSLAEIENIRRVAARCLDPIGKKVPAVVNYDNFVIAPELMDAYMEMVHEIFMKLLM